MTARQTILVTDDDPDLREIVRTILESHGFQVVEASDGQAALERIRAQRPDLLILDCNMPRMDGLQVCQTLKADMFLRHVPIIMLTGRGEVTDKVHGMDSGADDYVVKPFEPQELLARVRTILRRTTQELEANPLTQLPGNVSIQKELEGRLAAQKPLAVCYCDLNRFKAFNDHYGFARGDQAITRTAQVLLEAVHRAGGTDDFVGHIGGDDFVIITIPERADAICQEIAERFDDGIRALYDEADRARGYVLHMDRQGTAIKVGFLTIAIALVSNTQHPLTHVGQIAKIGAELKARAKRVDHSVYVKERRAT